MSYAEKIREELLALPLKRPCCKRALTFGLLTGAKIDGESFTVSYKNADVAAYAADCIRRQLGKQPEATERSAYGRRWTELTLTSPAAAKVFRKMRGGESVEAACPFACEGCHAAYLRGAFLACATVSDPQKSFHLEFSVAEERAGELRGFLENLGYPPGEIKRSAGVGLYYKNANTIEELLAMMGASHSAMEIINILIERDIRNQENRATNCVAKNIEKSVSAASKQMEAIEKLTLSGMLAQLSDGIRYTARLRAENPDATLEELRMLHEPPITKSGLNHRLQKILFEADKL